MPQGRRPRRHRPPRRLHRERPPGELRALKISAPEGRRRLGGFPFPGGAASAALLTLAFSSDGWRAASWLGLVPFLWSLERNSGLLVPRLAHGAMFGGLLALLGSPPWPGLLASMGFCAALFAAAAGPVLRARSTWATLAGVPVLWAGIEVLRGALVAPQFSSWLSLGHSAVPGLPEAEIASVLGVHGLGLLFALGSTAFLLVLRARSGALQLILGAAAMMIPLAAHGAGKLLAPPDLPPAGVAVVVAAQSRLDVGNLVQLTDRLAAARPRLVVWPGMPLVRIPTGGESLLEASREAGDLAIRLGATVVLGIEEEDAGGIGTLERAAVVGPDGKVAGRRATARAGEPALEDGGARVFPLGSGKFGLALGSELLKPSLARRLVHEGAGLLVLQGGDRGAWPNLAEHLHERMILFRAIECRRFIAKSECRGAFLADPRGRKLASVAPGLEGAAVEEAAILEGRSPYVRAGWLIEPCSLFGAIGIVVLLAICAVRKRGPRITARSPACPPGAPRAPFRT